MKAATDITTGKPPCNRAGNVGRLSALLALAFAVALGANRAAAQPCAGDCDGDGEVRVNEVVTGVNIGLGTLTVSECAASDADGDGAVSIGELIRAVRNGLEGCSDAAVPLAFVVATDFETGAFATISLDPPRTVDPVSSNRLLNSDAVPRVFGDRVYVVNRFFGDNIQALDPERGFATEWQCSTGNGSNPQDIVVLGTEKAYVTRLAERTLLVANPNPSPDCSDFDLKEIDLSAFADADGFPEMTQMALVDGLLYVALQRLDNFAPAGPGRIAVIDTATDTVVGDITLSGENPFGATKGLPVRDGALLVSQIGSFGVDDGGIERVDLVSGEAEGFFVTEESLGGDINDFVLVSDSLGYAIVALPDFTTSLVSFDPSTGERTGAVLEGVEFLADIELNDRGELYVLDRTFDRPGVRIFRAADATEITAAPLDVGLAPFEVVFYPKTPVASGASLTYPR